MLPDDPRHGTLAGYSAHRRVKLPTCEPCKLAMADYERSRQTRRYLARGALTTDGTGTRRRLQALAAIGWTFQEIDELLDRKRGYTSRLVNETVDTYRTTRDRVVIVYERLSMTPRVGWIADRQRRQARARGWLPPLAWDDHTIDDPKFTPGRTETIICKDADEIAVERFLAGDHTVPTKRPERVLIVAEYLRLGRPLAELERCGWKPERYFDRADGAA